MTETVIVARVPSDQRLGQSYLQVTERRSREDFLSATIGAHPRSLTLHPGLDNGGHAAAVPGVHIE
ncbi:hypothetical protein GCM10009662_50100 [Catellatospora coxensis]|uniref:Uncharacterized protein n=1 Tax=Catellatospora coxensis TaxID=310354 RepID=A0A8J3KVS0_9ACTN|nr:hypothetical protein Cco03nite_28490 [Catellatospora coxensis]